MERKRMTPPTGLFENGLEQVLRVPRAFLLLKEFDPSHPLHKLR